MLKLMVKLICMLIFSDVTYHSCTIENVTEVSHDTNLYCLCLPEACRLCVPLGYHVPVKIDLEGEIEMSN